MSKPIADDYKNLLSATADTACTAAGDAWMHPGSGVQDLADQCLKLTPAANIRGWSGKRLTANAGRYAAHYLRLRHWDQGKDAEPWEILLTRRDCAETITGTATAARVSLAGRLLTAMRFSADQTAPHALGIWLNTLGGFDLIPQTAHLCRIALNDPTNRQAWMGAWFAVHGQNFTKLLAWEPLTVGRPYEQSEIRRGVALGLWSAHAFTKTEITQWCGISRPTLNQWITT